MQTRKATGYENYISAKGKTFLYPAPTAIEVNVEASFASTSPFVIYALTIIEGMEKPMRVPIHVNESIVEIQRRFKKLKAIEVEAAKEIELVSFCKIIPIGSPELDNQTTHLAIEPPKATMEEIVRREIRKAMPRREQRQAPDLEHLMGDEIAEQHAEKNYEVPDDEDDPDPMDPEAARDHIRGGGTVNLRTPAPRMPDAPKPPDRPADNPPADVQTVTK